MEKITKFIISNEENIEVTNIEQGVSTKTHDILVKRSGKKTESIYYLKNYSNTKKIELYFEDGEKINLDSKILDSLLIYIQSQHNINLIIGNNSYFDCNAFVHFLNSVPYSKDTFDKNQWDIFMLDMDEPLQIGETILTGLNEINGEIIATTNSHFSIYLGRGLFLGKSGTSGNPIVYNLKKLNELYPFNINVILKIIPKK